MIASDIKSPGPHYWTGGAGTPVLALHSSGSTGQQWQNLSEHIRGRFRTIAPDLPGYGGTPAWPGKGAASVENEARAIARLIKAAGEPVHLVGHSWGGTIAIKIAMALPEWTRSLTLIEPAIFHLLRDAKNAADQALFGEIAAIAGVVCAAAADGHAEAGMGRFIDFWNGTGAWANSSPRLRAALKPQLGQVVNNFVAGFNETWTLDEAANITCPTLAIMGMESMSPAQRVTEMLAETIPASTLAMIPGAGHMAPLTDPHIVDPLIFNHLRKADQEPQTQTVPFEIHSFERAA